MRLIVFPPISVFTFAKFIGLAFFGTYSLTALAQSPWEFPFTPGYESQTGNQATPLPGGGWDFHGDRAQEEARRQADEEARRAQDRAQEEARRQADEEAHRAQDRAREEARRQERINQEQAGIIRENQGSINRENRGRNIPEASLNEQGRPNREAFERITKVTDFLFLRQPPDGKPIHRINTDFLVGKEAMNTGLLVMIHTLLLQGPGQKLLRYYMPIDNSKLEDHQIQIAEKGGRIKFAQFGEKPFWKFKGTTNCTNLVLEGLFDFLGGIGGWINGVPITSRVFNVFNEEFRMADESWIDPLVDAQMARRIYDFQQLRPGDMVQFSLHRAFVLELKRDGHGRVTHVRVFEATMPDSDWENTSALRTDRWFRLPSIRHAARLYDLAPTASNPWVGLTKSEYEILRDELLDRLLPFVASRNEAAP